MNIIRYLRPSKQELRELEVPVDGRIMVRPEGLHIYKLSEYPNLMREIFYFMISNFDYYNSDSPPDAEYVLTLLGKWSSY